MRTLREGGDIRFDGMHIQYVPTKSAQLGDAHTVKGRKECTVREFEDIARVHSLTHQIGVSHSVSINTGASGD